MSWSEYKDYKLELTKLKEFSSNLILLPRTILKIRAILNHERIHVLDRIYYLKIKNKAIFDIKTILALLNTKLMTFLYNYFYGSTKIGGGYIDLKGTQISNFLIPKKIENQENIIICVDKLLNFNKKIQVVKQNFLNELELEKIPKKLQNFEELDFNGFIKEYKKAKKLKFKNKLEERNFKNEWKDLFENDKKEALELQAKIDATDREIDMMVYELYGLSDDEVALVEGKA